MISKVYEKKLQEDLFRLAMMTLVTTVICIVVVVYRTLVKSEIKPEVKKQLLLLTPTLELDTIDSIKQRLTVPEESWESLQVQKIITATGSASQTGQAVASPVATPKASPIVSPSASPTTQTTGSTEIDEQDSGSPEPNPSEIPEGDLEGVPLDTDGE